MVDTMHNFGSAHQWQQSQQHCTNEGMDRYIELHLPHSDPETKAGRREEAEDLEFKNLKAVLFPTQYFTRIPFVSTNGAASPLERKSHFKVYFVSPLRSGLCFANQGTRSLVKVGSNLPSLDACLAF